MSVDLSEVPRFPVLEKERIDDEPIILLVADAVDELLDELFDNASKLPKAFNKEVSVTQQRT